MDNLFNNILVNSSNELTFLSAIVSMLVALIYGIFIASTYYITQEAETYQRSITVTLLMLPIILSVVIVYVGSNVARAFSLAGTLSIVRFRSKVGDAKDIGFVFFAITSGLACGIGLYGYGALFVIIMCLIIFITQKKKLFTKNSIFKVLKITIPDNFSYEEAFKDVLTKYTDSYFVTKINTSGSGNLLEVTYTIKMKKGKSEQNFLNELRQESSTLSIAISALSNL